MKRKELTKIFMISNRKINFGRIVFAKICQRCKVDVELQAAFIPRSSILLPDHLCCCRLLPRCLPGIYRVTIGTSVSIISWHRTHPCRLRIAADFGNDVRVREWNTPLATRCSCDVESTSMTLFQRRNSVVCPVRRLTPPGCTALYWGPIRQSRVLVTRRHEEHIILLFSVCMRCSVTLEIQ